MAVADNDVQMQTDIDAHAAAGAAVAAAAAIPTPTTPPPEPVVSPQTPANFEVLMQQQFMKFMQGMFASMAATSSPSGAAGSSPSGVQSVPGGPSDVGHLANVRLDERAFRRLDRFSNKREDWREWRTHLLTAVRECDESFADSLEGFEKSDKVIEKVDLTPTLRQLSATLQARLIAVTSKEAFSIITACDGQGIEAWRQLVKRYDPQTDARFANLVNDLIGFRITRGQDVQSEMVKWEAMLLAMDRDHGEKFSPKMRRCLLLSILPQALRDRLLEHLDRLVDYAQLREKIVALVQVARSPSTDANNLEEQDEEAPAFSPEDDCTQEEYAMDLAALAEVVCHRCARRGTLQEIASSHPPKVVRVAERENLVVPASWIRMARAVLRPISAKGATSRLCTLSTNAGSCIQS